MEVQWCLRDLGSHNRHFSHLRLIVGAGISGHFPEFDNLSSALQRLISRLFHMVVIEIPVQTWSFMSPGYIDHNGPILAFMGSFWHLFMKWNGIFLLVTCMCSAQHDALFPSEIFWFIEFFESLGFLGIQGFSKFFHEGHQFFILSFLNEIHCGPDGPDSCVGWHMIEDFLFLPHSVFCQFIAFNWN